jgi:ComF family protein
VIETVLHHGQTSLQSQAVFDLPTPCAVCRGWSRQRLCAACLQRHAPPRNRCTGCGLSVADGVAHCGACIAAPLPFTHTVAAVDYAFPWSGLVTAFKFHAAIDLADALARVLADAVRAHDAAPPPDAVLPLPLGRERLAERGMNQAWELARRVARRLRLRAEPGALVRRVETPHLADLPRDERAKTIRGAFALAPGASTVIAGRHIALVDDVMTTGATAGEAARTLLGGGAASVRLWVLARTP